MLRATATLCVIILAGLLVFGAGDLLAKKPVKPPPEPPPAADPVIAYRDGGDLMVMNADGSNRTRLLDTGDYSHLSKPDWSPDGSRLVFWSDLQGSGIYTIKVDGTGLSKLIATSVTFAVSNPAWSPDGSQIAFVDQPVNFMNDLYVVDADDADLTQLTFTPDDSEIWPTWSPSGTKIAVKVASNTYRVGDRWGLYDLTAGTYSIRYHEGPLRGVGVAHPAWAKTREDKIAWLSSADIWVVDLDDPANPVRLTNTGDRQEESPCWSPDDTKLVFKSTQYKGKGAKNPVFEVMSASDGSGRTKIADAGAYPAWCR